MDWIDHVLHSVPKGYKLLNDGERIKEGDIFFHEVDKKWYSISETDIINNINYYSKKKHRQVATKIIKKRKIKKILKIVKKITGLLLILFVILILPIFYVGKTDFISVPTYIILISVGVFLFTYDDYI